MIAREKDWRIGPIVYQVFVDRFAASARLPEKEHFYSPPKRLRAWDQKPERGVERPDLGVWSHELDFWGGDLDSLMSRLDHVQRLADVLYLNPIHEAFTNHKYDATRWDRIAPEYGTWSDFERLSGDLRRRSMRLVLDGVFNHSGRANPMFQQALKDERSPYRDWFTFGKGYPSGYRAWANVPNLPEVRLETKAAREALWLSKDSVVAKYLRAGADGWRLDVAHELGLEFLSELTQAARRHKPGSLVLGEVWNYPSRWTRALDGVLNMHLGMVIAEFAKNHLSARQVAGSLSGLVQDCGIEPLLRSWIVLGNHDTPRLATSLPETRDRRFAQALQFTLPGSPLIYYGDEVGMPGGDDPEQRAPMDWASVAKEGQDLLWTRKLVDVRRRLRALRIGEYRSLEGERVLGFLRTTERPLECTIVLANPYDEAITESWVVPDGTLMGYTLFRDVLNGDETRIQAGVLRMEVPPKTVRILTIDEEANRRAQYKRMKDGD